MKRRITAFLLGALLLLMSGCGKPVEKPADLPAEDAQQTPATLKPHKGEDIQPMGRPDDKNAAISELYGEDGVYTDQWNQRFEYTYHVPQLTDGTSGATAINHEIKEAFGSLVKNSLVSMETKDTPEYLSVTYESFQNGDILSVVLKSISCYEAVEYGVYNYDIANGTQVDNAEILAMQGVSPDEFLTAARIAAVRAYDERYFAYWGDNLSLSSGEYQYGRSWAASPLNITVETPLYLDENGEIKVAAAVSPPLDLPQDYAVLTPTFERAGFAEQTAELGDIATATLKDGALSIRLHETSQCEALLLDHGYNGYPAYGEELPVHGLYGDDYRMFSAFIGDPMRPYLFLVTDEGRLEYVDVLSGIMGRYFCVAGPLLSVYDVASIATNYVDDGIEDAYASCLNGEMVELAPLIEASRNGMSVLFTAAWTVYITYEMDHGNSYENFYALEIFGSDDVVLQSVASVMNDPREYKGNFSYMGTAEDGAVYHYRLYNTDAYGGLAYQGAAALLTEDRFNDALPGRRLYFKELGGGGMFSTVMGETTELVESFG